MIVWNGLVVKVNWTVFWKYKLSRPNCILIIICKWTTRGTFEINTAKLTEPFIASHLLRSLEVQLIDRYNTVQWSRQRGTDRDSSVFSMFWEHEREREREMLHLDTEWAYKHFIFNISVSSRSRGRRRPNLELAVNGIFFSCSWNGLRGCGIKIAKDVIL